MIRLALFLLLAQSSPRQSQRPAQVAPQPEYTGPRGSISGTVINSVTGGPIRKAQIGNIAGVEGNAVTDSSGSFRFEQVPPGTYFLSAQHPEYPNRNGRQPVPLVLAPGEAKSGIEIKLTPASFISGHIADEDGDPVANCQVSLLQKGYGRAAATLLSVGQGATNGQGEYKISGVPEGRYYAEAHCTTPLLQPRPFAAPDAILPGPQQGYGSRFYPGVTSFTGAQSIRLASGAELRGIDFRMTLQPVTTVVVKVTGVEPSRGNRIAVTLTPAGSGPRSPVNKLGAMLQPGTGTALIRSVPLGSYTLTVNSLVPERAVLARQTIQAGEETREFVVQATPPTPLPGIVHYDRPPATAPNSAAVPPTRISLSSMDDESTNVQSSEVSSDGTFTLRSTYPGRWRASLAGSGFVQSVMLGNQTTQGPEFEIKPGASGPLEVTVGSTMGQITGEIEMQSTAAAVHIVVLATEGQMNSAIQDLTTVPGQPARFSMSVPPGHYTLYALETNNAGSVVPLVNSEALSSAGAAVDVPATGDTAKNLKLITADVIEKALAEVN